PSSLTATATGSSQINLAWTASSGAVTTYLVERCQTTPCSTPPIATESGTTYTDTTGLAASTTYTYRVQASGPGGSSPYANTPRATPTRRSSDLPSSLTATAASSSQISLAWTAASGAVTTYLVERCQGTPCTFTRSEERPAGAECSTDRPPSPSNHNQPHPPGAPGPPSQSTRASR